MYHPLKNLRPITKFFVFVVLVILLLGLFFLVLVFRAYLDINKGLKADSNNYDFSKIDVRIFPLVVTEDDPSWGNKKAKLVVVQFADFLCPVCAQAQATFRKLNYEYQDKVLFVFRDYPVINEDSFIFALAGECAKEQDLFWQFYDKVYSFKDATAASLPTIATTLNFNMPLFNACLDNQKYKLEVTNDLLEGEKAGVTGTPTYFINGHIFSGNVPYEMLKKILDESLAALGESLTLEK